MPKILDSIVNANDIKKISPEDYDMLAYEIRRFLISKISKTGGHVASNLGVVELTMALHLCMNFPEDKLVWDVGHQAYTHKILTGRKDEFNTLRTYKGLSGFPKVAESDCDAFDTGHSSTSISVALGLAKARDLQGKNNKVFAVIGDGALSGGMAYEALNNAARLKSNMVVVLNDNNMSINENVGGMASYLGTIRTGNVYTELKNNVESTLNRIPLVGEKLADKVRASKDVIKRMVIPGMLFEDMGITYIGPIDGHDIELLVKAFNTASKAKEAVIVHVVTKKGKGYRFAEENPSKFHGINKFETKTGECMSGAKSEATYTDVFSDTMLKLAREDDKVIAISAAMVSGTGLTKFARRFPSRLIDVGIAEEHAVTFAAGLAAGGMKPVVALYSTFLQRAYDQVLHDVCLNNQHVVFAIDRAGIVGPDGSTHQGIYDMSFLRTIPELTVVAPKNGAELEKMLEYAIMKFDKAIVVRYPKGNVYNELSEYNAEIEYGKAEVICEGKDVALLAIGSMVKVANEVRGILESEGYSVTLVNMRFAAPIDKDCIISCAKIHKLVVSVEENVYTGGIGQTISAVIKENGIDVENLNISVEDKYVEHGDRDILLKDLGLDAETIVNKIKEIKVR